MGCRCPAWCDRVLLSHDAAEKLVAVDGHRQNGVSASADIHYDVIGPDVCMGDHKPVFLSFGLLVRQKAPTPTTMTTTEKILERICDVSGRELPPSIESPSYTDLLDNSLYSKYIELRDKSAASMKMFKETTV